MKYITFLLISIVLGVYTLINYYIGANGFGLFKKTFPAVNSKIYWIIFWIIVFSFIISRLISKYLPGIINYGLSVTGYYWMAAMVYFLIIIVISNLVNLILKHASPRMYEIIFKSSFASLGGLFIIIFVICILVIGTVNARHPVIKNYNVQINKRAGNIKKLNIVFAADLHIGEIIDKKRIEPLIETINKLSPDIVLFGGDVIDDNPNTFIKQNIGDLFKKIRSKYGLYTVLGNHEYYSSKTGIIEKTLNGAGINVLRDRYIEIDNSFYLVGREDKESRRFGIVRKPLADIMKDTDKSLPVILLDHQPPGKKEALDGDADLQLSGHTHRGQLYPASLITEKIYAIDWGYLKKGNFNLIVTDGYGTWGPPIRLGNKPEIVHITVSFESK